MIHGVQTRAFRRLFLERPPHPLSTEQSKEIIDSAPTTLQELISAGLLTMSAHEGRPVAPTFIPPPTEPLIDSDIRAVISGGHILTFLVSCAVAFIGLRTKSIERVVDLVQTRKTYCSRNRTIDLSSARQLVRVFNKLRYAFPTNYLCLFDSLALIEFLARYKIFPEWTFGVQLEPWAAHCWVQSGSVLFNDSIEETSDYIPIMSV
jgi:hypothetical protein